MGSKSVWLSVSLSFMVCPGSAVAAEAGAPVAVRSAATRPAAGTAPASQPAVVDFQPGIRIDWGRRQVEVAATVILRRGAIELFACCPQIREHEAIVRIEARPLHLYHALGLIGLNPGHPIRWREDTDEEQAATGDPVEIEVRYTLDGKVHQEPIERWMRFAPVGQPTPAPGPETPAPGGETPPARGDLDPLPWVFAGSFPIEDGAIAADAEGTVVAVVNFGSALIALPESHSDSNAELWLEPATERIPPEDTSCTLVFRAGPLWLELDAAGRVRHEGKTLTLAALGRAVRAFREGAPDRRVRVTVDPKCPPGGEAALLRLLKSLKVPDQAITIIRRQAGQVLRHDPKALAAWARGSSTPGGLAERAEQTWATSARQLAGDLRERSFALGTRTRGVAEHASHWIDDARRLAAPRDGDTAADRSEEP